MMLRLEVMKVWPAVSMPWYPVAHPLQPARLIVCPLSGTETHTAEGP